MILTLRASPNGMRRLPQALLLVMGVVSLPARPMASQDDLARGQDLFQEHCAVCHGPSGEGGRGPALAMPRLAHAQTDEELTWLIQYGVPGSAMPESRLEDDEIKHVAAWVRKLGQLPVQAGPGNVERGARLYRDKGGCVRCHSIKGYGGAIGPDLTEIGSRRGTVYLRTSLTEPEADVPTSSRHAISLPENFLLVEAERHGRRIVGVRVNEDAFSIQIRDLSGELHSLLKSDITALRKEWGKSPMPSYRSVFSEEELNDVVAFLASLRGGQ